MKKLLLCVMLAAPAVVPQVAAQAATEHCPGGWIRKTEPTVESPSAFIRRPGNHCFKYGTETSGEIYVERGLWTSPNGKDISYFVCYPK